MSGGVTQTARDHLTRWRRILPENRQRSGNKTSFKKGQSGNPGGRPKDLLNIRELARTYAPDAIQTLVEIMQSAPESSARVSAAREILDRGFGKPTQHVDMDIREKPTEQLVSEAKELIAALEADNA